jgi:hypothetical protein
MAQQRRLVVAAAALVLVALRVVTTAAQVFLATLLDHPLLMLAVAVVQTARLVGVLADRVAAEPEDLAA